jgi:hypothetical protein
MRRPAARISLLAAFSLLGWAAMASAARPCPREVTQEVDKLNRGYVLLGAKAFAHANSCDESGRLAELVFVRTSDQKVFRWRQSDGGSALTNAYILGEASPEMRGDATQRAALDALDRESGP